MSLIKRAATAAKKRRNDYKLLGYVHKARYNEYQNLKKKKKNVTKKSGTDKFLFDTFSQHVDKACEVYSLWDYWCFAKYDCFWLFMYLWSYFLLSKKIRI